MVKTRTRLNIPNMSFLDFSEVNLQHAIERLLAEYIHCIDDDQLEVWPSFFTESCLYQIVARENLDRGLPLGAIYCDSRGMLTDRVVSIRKANIYEAHHYRHLLSGVYVEQIKEEYVRVKSNYVVFRTRANGESEVYSTGLYKDTIIFVDKELKFTEKTVVYDTSRIDSALVTPI